MSNLQKKNILEEKISRFAHTLLSASLQFSLETTRCLVCAERAARARNSYTHLIDKISSPVFLCMSDKSRCFPFYRSPFHRNDRLLSFLWVYSTVFTITFPLRGRVSSFFFIIKSENNGCFEKYANPPTKQTVYTRVSLFARFSSAFKNRILNRSLRAEQSIYYTLFDFIILYKIILYKILYKMSL